MTADTELRKAAERLERARSAVSQMRYDESPQEKARILTERDEALDAFHVASGDPTAILALLDERDAERAAREKAEADLKATTVNLEAVSLMLRNERAAWMGRQEGTAKVVAQLEEESRRLRALIAWAYSTLTEINPSNYDHDEVCRLNDASVEVILGLKDEALKETPHAAE
jgi:hypothetical protein